LWLWLRAQGKELYDGAKLAFTPADAQRWFELWAGARARHATPSVNTIVAANNADNGTQPLLAKLALTAFGWSNTLAEMQRGTDHELGLTAYPGDPKSQWSRASMYWSIFSGSKHADVVADVINFFVNDSEAGKLIGTERGLPPQPGHPLPTVPVAAADDADDHEVRGHDGRQVRPRTGSPAEGPYPDQNPADPGG
jgi:multiple sugar transport system substrate-binding protein